MENEVSKFALQAIQGGASLMRLENETQMSIAIQRKRDEASIREDCLMELDQVPEAAEAAIYRKPGGKDKKCRIQYVV